jgi:outer membrane protein assembly factor BamB
MSFKCGLPPLSVCRMLLVQFVGKPIAAAILAAALSNISAAENWARFRGPNGAGQSDDSEIPTMWDDANFLWKQPVAGVGHSSPVIWGEKLFLTSADASTGTQVVSAYDLQTGTPLWQKQFSASTYHINNLNSRASSTPAVDSHHVYVLWLDHTNVKLAALDHDGNEAWQSDIGTFEETHGYGVSPVVVDDLVIVQNDNPAKSSITALDCKTGHVRWSVPRESGTTSFATPCVLDANGKEKLLLTASTAAGLSALSVKTGNVVWHGFQNELSQRCVGSPIVANGIVFVGCGQGGNGKLILAVRPGENDSPPQELYRLQQSAPQVPTPVVAGNLLFLWSDRGIVSCYDLATGKQHWRERVGGDFHASPLCIGNRIFGFSRGGEIVVLAASKEFKVLARNALGEPCIATPAIASHCLFLRTETNLYCIGQKATN